MKAIKAHWARDARTIKEELGGSFHDVVSVARAHVNKVIYANEALEKKLDGMQKTLGWYADEDNYDLPEGEYYIPTKLDRGDRARQALKGESQ